MKLSEKSLPPEYYLEHFESMLSFVEEHCSGLLSVPDRSSIHVFRALSKPARLLFVRLFNRKSKFFRLLTLEYAEIADLLSASNELRREDFLRFVHRSEGEISEKALEIFPAHVIRSVMKKLAVGTSGLTKKELLNQMVEKLGIVEALSRCNPERDLVEICRNEDFEFFKFLFFGDAWSEMSEFVLRDLRETKYAGESAGKFRSKFANRDSARHEFLMQMLHKDFRVNRVRLPGEELFDWLKVRLEAIRSLNPCVCPGHSGNSCDRLLLSASRHFADAGMLQHALELLERTDRSPAREQRVRLLVKLGRSDAALKLVEEMHLCPHDPREEYFARDYMRKSCCTKAIKSTRAYLKNSEIICLATNTRALAQPGAVEAAAVDYFRSQGWEAFHTENSLWRALFGLLFWRELFGGAAGAIHCPFQLEPSLEPEAANGGGEIDEAPFEPALRMLDDKNRLLDHLEDTYYENLDKANAYVNWHPSPLPLLAQCCLRLSSSQLRAVLLRMLKKSKSCMSGFPDLFCYCRANDYQFVEVKGPNDELSATQLGWLKFFEQQSINAKAVKIEWERGIAANRMRSGARRVV